MRDRMPDSVTRWLQYLVCGSGFLLLVLAAHAQVLAASEKKHGLCSDYDLPTDYTGQPYYIVDPEDGRVTRRHGGMDFCVKAGSDVLAPADGEIWDIVWDNPVRGGSVTIKTAIMLKRPGLTTPIDAVYVRTVHIDPDRSLLIGQKIRAGTVIGKVQQGGKEQIGPRSHVHLDAGKCSRMWLDQCKINPNDFWADGPRKITCFDPETPPPPDKFVAPVRCW